MAIAKHKHDAAFVAKHQEVIDAHKLEMKQSHAALREEHAALIEAERQAHTQKQEQLLYEHNKSLETHKNQAEALHKRLSEHHETTAGKTKETLEETVDHLKRSMHELAKLQLRDFIPRGYASQGGEHARVLLLNSATSQLEGAV